MEYMAPAVPPLANIYTKTKQCPRPDATLETIDMDYRTPWDDLDLDPMVSPRQLPRFELSAPGFYFALLPQVSYPRDWDTRWQKADSAHDMRLITADCIDYERRILNKVAAYRLKDSFAISATIEAQQKVKKDLETATVTLAASVVDQKQNARKRGRGAKSEMLTPIRRSKRIRFARDKKNGSAPPSPPPSPPLGKIPLKDAATKPETARINTPPSREKSMTGPKSPRFNPYNNSNSTCNIVDIHQKIYCAVDAWHDLVLQAEAVEHNLLAFQSQSDMNSSSLRQSDMSRDELEELHAKLQNSANRTLAELDAASVSAINMIGFRSLPMAEFRASDPRERKVLSYEFELEWQMKESGLFAWWLCHFNEQLR